MALEKLQAAGITMNFNPEDYSASNNTQQEIFRHATKDYPIQWGSDETVLDVGCGTGEVTKLLLDSSPSTTRVVGFDINKRAIEFAARHATDGRISFVEGDATGVWPPEWTAAFTRVVSFLALQFVDNQERFLRSAFSALRPGGSVYFVIPIRHRAAEVNRLIATDERWSAYLANMDLLATGESEWKKPDIYRRICENSGFTVHRVAELLHYGEFANDADMIKWVRGFNLFAPFLPAEKLEEFELDYKRKLQDLEENEHGSRYKVKVILMIVEAERPVSV